MDAKILKGTFVPALALTALLVSGTQPIGAECYECVYDEQDEQTGCLLGCPEDNPDCVQITECEVVGPGHCKGEDLCGGLAFTEDLTASGHVLASRSETSSAAVSNIPFEGPDGSVLLRRRCDAVVVGVTYSATAIAAVNKTSAELTL